MLRRRHLPALLLPTPALAAASPLAVASFSILGDLLRDVAGPAWDVRVVAGPDTDPHSFQPRPSQAQGLVAAQVALRQGAGFDGWFDRLLRAARFPGRLITASAGLPLRAAVPTPGHNHGGQDPHLWQDAQLAAGMARNIAAGLGVPAPGLEEVLARLAMLDEWIRAQIATVPPARRVVVTNHDAFGYYGAAYGVRFLAPQGISTQAEPSAQAVTALIRQIRSQGITAVFVEGIANTSTLQRLATEAGVQIRGRLFSDSLSGLDGPAPTHDAMLRHNTRLMVAAMRNDAS